MMQKHKEVSDMSSDLILDQTHAPTIEEIVAYIQDPGKGLWQGLNRFLQEQFGISPKITYSVCSGKPGWNVKYHKSGKSLCTLYPEKQGFVALLVIKQELREVVQALPGLDEELLDVVRKAAPFNGTLWLMVPVYSDQMLEGIKELLLLKAGK